MTKKTAAKKPATSKPAAKPTTARATRCGVAYELIKAGKTNLEVLAALKAQFNLPAAHSYYPSWYRAKLVSDGVITAAFAAEHRGPALRRQGPDAGQPMEQATPAKPAPAAKPAPEKAPAQKARRSAKK